MPRLTASVAEKFARIALGHVSREFPHKLDHVLRDASDVKRPRELHPIFYGSFDWHSCVHGYWLLVRVRQLFPNLPAAAEIRALLDEQMTSAHVAGECAYLAQPSTRGFERPYGWAWLLKLAAQLTAGEDPDSKRWSLILEPLAHDFAHRFLEFLPKATYPTRTGTHFNSAFALTLALDWAVGTRDRDLETLIRSKALAWFENDAACKAWEPGGDDFLSPALMEMELMRRVLPAGAFAAWRDRFLPQLAERRPGTLFTPATVSDRSDGKIAHLDGLNLSRAWCWRGLAATWPEADLRHAIALEAAEIHLESALPHLTSDYMGEHWLATFALLALDSGAAHGH